MTDDKIEAAAREAGRKWSMRGGSPGDRVDCFNDGFKTGHRSRDAEIAAKDEEHTRTIAQKDASLRLLLEEATDLRARLDEAEARAAKWCEEEEYERNYKLGWKSVEIVYRGRRVWLMVPPVPLPETETEP